MTQNKNKLIQLKRYEVRYEIQYIGVWNGLVKMTDNKIHYATFTNFASLQDKNILEFYKLNS